MATAVCHDRREPAWSRKSLGDPNDRDLTARHSQQGRAALV
jgi:hypothetical protein